MPFKENENERLSKRKEYFNQVVTKYQNVTINKAVKNLTDIIDRFQTMKEDDNTDDQKYDPEKIPKLGPKSIEEFISAYESCGVAFKNAYDKVSKKINDCKMKNIKVDASDEEEAQLYLKLMKKFSKDYSALFRYKKKLDKGLPSNKWISIEEFYDTSRTRTISMGGKSLDEMGKSGAGMSVRYKIPITIEDEQIEGVNPGENYFGFFTEDVDYGPDVDPKNIPLYEDIKICKQISEKYPAAQDALNANEKDHTDWFFIAQVLSYSELDNVIRQHPGSLFIDYSLDNILEYAENAVQNCELIKEEDFRNDLLECITEIKDEENEDVRTEKVHAFVEYCSAAQKSIFGNNVLNGVNIDPKTSVAQRNALMSNIADILGCSDSIAFSEKIRVKTVEDGKTVVKKGVIMMPAKGEDSSATNPNGGIANMDRGSIENSKGLVKSIASLQFLDYICGNVDRHLGNFFYQFDKSGKLVAVMGIDNDNSFIGREDYEELGHVVAFKDLRVIPKSMADIVKKMSVDTFKVLLQGYGIKPEEVDVSAARFEDVKQKIIDSEQHYKDAIPGYLEDNVPRIVPDKELDDYSVNEQLVYKNKDNTRHSNIFGKLASSKLNNMGAMIHVASNNIADDANELEVGLIRRDPGSLNDNANYFEEYLVENDIDYLNENIRNPMNDELLYPNGVDPEKKNPVVPEMKNPEMMNPVNPDMMNPVNLDMMNPVNPDMMNPENSGMMNQMNLEMKNPDMMNLNVDPKVNKEEEDLQKKKNEAVRKMYNATNNIFDVGSFYSGFITASDDNAYGDETVYDFVLEEAEADAPQNGEMNAPQNGEKKAPEKKEKIITNTYKDIEKDERYIALNNAYEATMEFLMDYSEIGMRYQELQEDVALASTNMKKSAALTALSEFKETDDCKLYLKAVENKNRLTEQMDGMVKLYKDCNDLAAARDKINKMEKDNKPSEIDSYLGSDMQKEAKQKVQKVMEEQSKKQLEALENTGLGIK